MPGSLNGEPGLLAECPGVLGSRSWQDWLGGPGGPGGLSANAGVAGSRSTAAQIGTRIRYGRMASRLSVRRERVPAQGHAVSSPPTLVATDRATDRFTLTA